MAFRQDQQLRARSCSKDEKGFLDAGSGGCSCLTDHMQLIQFN